MTNNPTQKLCPCSSNIPYPECCEPYHKGQKHAESAELLMRSRFSAYALHDADYLMRTTHRDNREYQKNAKIWRHAILNHCKRTHFLSLSVLDLPEGKPEPNYVCFEARIQQGEKVLILTEKSYFIPLGNRWVYHSGEAEIVPEKLALEKS